MAPLNQLRPGLTALWVGVLARAGLKGIAQSVPGSFPLGIASTVAT